MYEKYRYSATGVTYLGGTSLRFIGTSSLLDSKKIDSLALQGQLESNTNDKENLNSFKYQWNWLTWIKDAQRSYISFKAYKNHIQSQKNKKIMDENQYIAFSFKHHGIQWAIFQSHFTSFWRITRKIIGRRRRIRYEFSGSRLLAAAVLSRLRRFYWDRWKSN